MMVAHMTDNPDRRRVAVAAKKTVAVNVRLTVLEAARLRVAARQSDPPTLAHYIREAIVDRLARPRSRPPEK
jgi:hypothetical protein